MSFSDMKLTKGEKRLVASIFRLRLLLDRIPEPDPEDDDVQLLISLSRKELNAIGYALTMMEQIQRAAEDIETGKAPPFVISERRRKG